MEIVAQMITNVNILISNIYLDIMLSIRHTDTMGTMPLTRYCASISFVLAYVILGLFFLPCLDNRCSADFPEAMATIQGIPPNFVFDPKVGRYLTQAEIEERKPGHKRELSAETTAFLDSASIYRLYRYAFIGGGAGSSSMTQDGVPFKKSANTTLTMGIDGDGRFNHPLKNVELTGRFGVGDVKLGEFTAVWYLETTIPTKWPRRKIYADRPDDPFSGFWATHMDEIAEMADGYSAWRIGIGSGLMGVNFRQPGGRRHFTNQPDNVISGDAIVQVAGFPLAARVGYFGERTMVRLSGYWIWDTSALNGYVTEDKFIFPLVGGDVETSGKAKGRYNELKLDVYHRRDEAIRTHGIVTGYGVSLIYRAGKVGQSTASVPVSQFGAQTAEVTFPEAKFQQVELLFTVGRMF